MGTGTVYQHENFRRTRLREASNRLSHSMCEKFWTLPLQADLDEWLEYYNTERTHQGKMCCGRTPMQTLLEGKQLWNEKVGQLN